jgi:hypothetical protein
MSKWQETVGEGFGTGKHKGTTRDAPITDDRDGTRAATTTEHWDGRQDAVVHLKTVNTKTRVQQGDDL